jgi:hypothetical protein
MTTAAATPGLTHRLDSLLARLARAEWERLSVRSLVVVIFTAGPFYGAFMGSYALHTSERLLLCLYATVKMPLLVFVTAGLCLPAFFVLNTLVGLRGDFARSVRSILAAKAAFTLALASLVPVTRVMYLTGVTHRFAILSNALMFTVATCVAQRILWRWYRPLCAKDKRHGMMLWAWVGLYAFAGVRMGWMLRPFVGRPTAPVQFFRTEGFSNAYVEVVRLVRLVRGE